MKNIEYRYPYSREQFIENCKTVYREHQDKYLIKFNGDDEILFGVERAGHSGGYWFKSRLIERENGLHIIGEMILMDSDNKKIEFSKKDKIKETLFMIIFIILTWWLIIIVWFIKATNKLYNKIIGKKLEPQLTKEEKLDRLMINLLCCEKIQSAEWTV
jgi:hypothetical protein